MTFQNTFFASFCFFFIAACSNPTDPLQGPPPPPQPPPLEHHISFSLDEAATITFTAGPTDLPVESPFITIFQPSSGDNVLYLYASAEPNVFADAINLDFDYCRIWITRDADSYSGLFSTTEVAIELVLSGISYLTTTASNTLELKNTVDLPPEGELIEGSFEGNLQGFSISGTFSLSHQAVDLTAFYGS